MTISIDHLKWELVEGNNLSERISNPELNKKLSNISENVYFATTKTTIFLKRKDGRIISQPKNGENPFCVNCINEIGYKSPADYFEKEESYSSEKVKIPYCVNQDQISQL